MRVLPPPGGVGRNRRKDCRFSLNRFDPVDQAVATLGGPPRHAARSAVHDGSDAMVRCVRGKNVEGNLWDKTAK